MALISILDSEIYTLNLNPGNFIARIEKKDKKYGSSTFMAAGNNIKEDIIFSVLEHIKYDKISRKENVTRVLEKEIDPQKKLSYKIVDGDTKFLINLIELGHIGEMYHIREKVPIQKEGDNIIITKENLNVLYKRVLAKSIINNFRYGSNGNVPYIPDNKALIGILKNANHLFDVYSEIPVGSLIITSYNSKYFEISKKTKDKVVWNDHLMGTGSLGFKQNGEYQTLPSIGLSLGISLKESLRYFGHHLQGNFNSIVDFRRQSVVVDKSDEKLYWSQIENIVHKSLSVDNFPLVEGSSVPIYILNQKKKDFLERAKEYLQIK